MITVTYRRGMNRVSLEGHARSGEMGHDLVCCAASALALTLAANVKKLENAGYVRDAVEDLRPGNAVIACKPKYRMKATVTLTMDAVCLGFDLLARDYPEYIRLLVME